MSENPQDGSKYVDDPKYREENVLLQRRVHELEGMLEQKHGWLRRGLVSCGRGALWPFRTIGWILALPFRGAQRLRALYKVEPKVLVPIGFIAVILMGLGTLIFFTVKAQSLMEKVAKQPELTLQQLVAYDGWEADKGPGLSCEEGVLRLTSPDGKKTEYVHIPARAWHLVEQYDEDNLNVVWLVASIAQQEKEESEELAFKARMAAERLKDLDRIRKGSPPDQSPEAK